MTFDIQQELRDLVKKAQHIHSQEKQLVLESVKIIGELQRMNAAVNLSMSMDGFITHLGLTQNVFWKRSQAARLTYRFPEAMEMLEAGETEVSTIALVAPKVSDMLENLQLLCRFHNQGKAIQNFGASFMCKYTHHFSGEEGGV